MRRTSIAIVITLAVACTAEAQDLLGKVSCHAAGPKTPQNPPYTWALWNGYEVSLVVFDENHTGQDFDGDGHPDVVFITDSGGGNHCCWAYNVISLFPQPYKLFDIDAPRAVLTRANLERLTSAGTTGVDNEETVSNLLSRALQHVFCHQFDAALSDLSQWPEASRATMLAGFVDALKTTDVALAAKLSDMVSKK